MGAKKLCRIPQLNVSSRQALAGEPITLLCYLLSLYAFMPFFILTRGALAPRQARRSWNVGIGGQHLVTSDVLAQVRSAVG